MNKTILFFIIIFGLFTVSCGQSTPGGNQASTGSLESAASCDSKLGGAFEQLFVHNAYWEGMWFKDLIRTRALLVASAFQSTEAAKCTSEAFKAYVARTPNYSETCLFWGNQGYGCSADKQTEYETVARDWAAASKRIANTATGRVLEALANNTCSFISEASKSGPFRDLAQDMVYWGNQTDDPLRRSILRYRLSSDNLRLMDAILAGGPCP
jgi:hypothetical protein